MGLLENKTIVITGGSMGIGLAVAQRCSEEGASLILVSRHESDLEKAVKMLSNNGQPHTCYCLDVSNMDMVKKTADRIARERICIDALVNCAGVYGPIGKTDSVDPVQFAEAININLLGTFYMCRFFSPLLKKAKRGKIINYSGGGAAGPFPNYSAYAVSKAGIVRLTENLAMELKVDNIDVNAIAPGFVVTRLHQETIKAGQRAGEEFLEKTIEQVSGGGVSPMIAANLTVFLLSSASEGITGKFISASWDPWQSDDFVTRLRQDADFAVLRRIDGKTFFKKTTK